MKTTPKPSIPRALRKPLPPKPKVAEDILNNLSDGATSPLIAARNRLTILLELYTRGFESTAHSTPLDFAVCAALEDLQQNLGAIERQIAEAHAAVSGDPLLDTPEADDVLKGGRP